MCISTPTIFEFIVEPSEANTRLDIFLASRDLPISRSQIKRGIDNGACLINGAQARPSKKLKAGDKVRFDLPPPEPDEAEPQNIPLTILYEDEHVLVLDKPAGMVVHPAVGHRQGTLVNALLAHCGELALVGGKWRAGIVHRLDKLTSGVMVASKTDAAHVALQTQFSEHTIERRYVAIVSGELKADSGIFDTRHGRHPTERKRFTTRVAQGRRAITHWRVLKRFRGATLVEAKLQTGRTHQVRVHFAEHGHPVLGDPVYGKPPKSEFVRKLGQQLGRQALHAQVLAFDHPLTGERLRFVSELPRDMQEALNKLAEEK